MAKTILLTGGRAPATLDLARMLGRAGHRVLVADSMPHAISFWSNAVEKGILLPPPRQSYPLFKSVLSDVVQKEKVDLLIPTCEEVFYVSKARPCLDAHCTVFAPEFSILSRLHSKYQFILDATEKGLNVPRTVRVTNHDELLRACQNRSYFPDGVVVKPEFSRFASETLVLPTPDSLETCCPTPDAPWVVQAYLGGRQLASYSIVVNGRIRAHADYACRFTAGKGAAVAFKTLNHSAVLDWVTQFVSETSYSGQLAFDFIEQNNQIFAIECNPRLTSGIHLFHTKENLASAFLGNLNGEEVILPQANATAALKLPLFWSGLMKMGRTDRIQWGKQLFARNIIFDRQDALPSLGQVRAIIEVWRLAKKFDRSLLAATTADIEWNGEAEAVSGIELGKEKALDSEEWLYT